MNSFVEPWHDPMEAVDRHSRFIPARLVGILAAAALPLLLSACRGDQAKHMDALLAPFASDQAPGIAVMVLRDDAVLYRGARGMADVEGGVPIGPRTAFDLASVSKQFSGMLAMLLRQEGRLDYDAPVARFLPALSRFGTTLTVRHLLTHTSGLPDYYETLAGRSAPGTFATNRQALDLLASWGDPVFPPGDRFAYSDVGYEMLALVLEAASGEPFGNLLRRRIFEPLAMTDTRLRDRPDVAVPGRARGYVSRGQAFTAVPDHPLDCLFGSGAINTTVDDMRRWIRALDTGRLASPATLAEALRPQLLNDGSESGYAFGWYLENGLLGRRLKHPGAWNGYQSFVLRYPESRFSVILLANRTDIDLGDLAERIVRLYAGPLGTP
jgi:CubicO group peptidase (beta-lactamase class C family)